MSKPKGRASRGRMIRDTPQCDRSATILRVAVLWVADGAPSSVHFTSAHASMPDLQLDPVQMTLEICAEIVDRVRLGGAGPVSPHVVSAARHIVRAGGFKGALSSGEVLSAAEVSMIMAGGLLAVACPTDDDVHQLMRDVGRSPAALLVQEKPDPHPA